MMNREITSEDELRWENRRLASEVAELRVRAEAAEAWCESWKRGAGISSRERDEADRMVATLEAQRNDLVAEVDRLTNGIKDVAIRLQGLGHETPWKYGRELRALVGQ